MLNEISYNWKDKPYGDDLETLHGNKEPEESYLCDLRLMNPNIKGVCW